MIQSKLSKRTLSLEDISTSVALVGSRTPFLLPEGVPRVSAQSKTTKDAVHPPESEHQHAKMGQRGGLCVSGLYPELGVICGLSL